MLLKFTKMHGLGNDFVVINALEQAVRLSPARARRIADRRYGVGCDQLLLVRPARRTGADFRFCVFNADGSRAEQCGNGIRCVALYLRERGLAARAMLTAETDAGLVQLCFEGDLVRVNMGRPCFEPARIPLVGVEQQPLYRLRLAAAEVEVAALSLGNPHAVMLVDDVEQAPVAEYGAQLQEHARFPNGVNAGFMQVADESRVMLRVFERGVGETPACGSGACAAVVAGITMGRLARDVEARLRGGSLRISWAGDNEPVWMTGPATTVYEGQINL